MVKVAGITIKSDTGISDGPDLNLLFEGLRTVHTGYTIGFVFSMTAGTKGRFAPKDFQMEALVLGVSATQDEDGRTWVVELRFPNGESRDGHVVADPDDRYVLMYDTVERKGFVMEVISSASAAVVSLFAVDG